MLLTRTTKLEDCKRPTDGISIFYTDLPHYLLEFDILDTRDGRFLHFTREDAPGGPRGMRVPVAGADARFAVAFDVLRRWMTRGHHLDVTLGCFNTAVLIGSSLTMAGKTPAYVEAVAVKAADWPSSTARLPMAPRRCRWLVRCRSTWC